MKRIKLWETSVVVFPMNPRAEITGTKSAGQLDPLGLELALAEAELALLRLRE